MNNSSETFSNLENAVSRALAMENAVRASAMENAVNRASAMQNLANVMSAMQTSSNILPDVMKQMQVVQKAISSPVYQVLIRQQEILNQMSIPSVLMKEIQATSNLVQPALQNMNLSGFNNLVQSESFFKSALEVQKASIDFLTEMKKLDTYQQKTLGEILKELRLKKIFETELPKDFPLEVQENFTRFINSIVNLYKKNKKIFFMLDTITTFGSSSQYEVINIISYFVWFCLLINLLRGENFGGKQ